jgi:Fe-Mn family superoxide dismutase
MNHLLPQLRYSKEALSPYISSETMEYHYSKHHQTYVDNLNKLIIWTEFENSSLEEIIRSSSWPIFNNSAQIWNHTFYFETFSESPKSSPEWEILDLIDNKWGSFDLFKQEFTKSAVSNFWSGWTWLVKNSETEELEIINTSNAQTPIVNNKLIPLLTCDVWEHAYYIDYRNRRAEYLEKFWNIVDWNIVEERI